MNKRLTFNNLITSVFLLLILTTARGQNVKPSIQILSKVSDGEVWLRWAPGNYEVWKLGNTYGYRIERFSVQENGEVNRQTNVNLTQTPLRPLPQSDFQKFNNSKIEVAAVGELIYAESGEGEANAPAALLKQQSDQNNRFGMALLLCDLSLSAAEAAGLYFKDNTAQQNKRFIYRISVATPEGTQTVEPGVVVVDIVNTPPLKGFGDLTAEFKDRAVTLSWPTFTHKGVYGAYVIEKSTDGNAFTPITDLPYIPLTEDDAASEGHYVDSLENNNTSYYYRVKGITPFGETGPASNTVSGTGKDDLTGFIVIEDVQSISKKTAIRWNFPADHEKKIDGFIVSQSNNASTQFENLTKRALPKNTRLFEGPLFQSSTYVIVKAVDNKGKEITRSFPYYFHVEDNTPPSSPSGLSGTVNAQGQVSITWSPNKDTDILGYRVFTSSSLRNEFTEQTRFLLNSPFFLDTVSLETLTKKIYYKVVAVDQNYNMSDYSTAVAIPMPDVIAPASPVFTEIKTTSEAIELRWKSSASSDVKGYTLKRTTLPDTTRVVVKEWSKAKFPGEYKDVIMANGNFTYYLIAYDSSGNSSTDQSKQIVFSNGPEDDVKEFSASIDRTNKVILLKWGYSSPSAKCILYRKVNDEPFSLYQSLPSTPSEFSDKLITANNTYSYKIQLILETGNKTKLSKELKVPY